MRVLIIEDQLRVSELLKKFLDEKGFESQFVLTANDALAELEVQVFDVILLDINLPDISGLELISKIRSCEMNSNVGIIILSGLDKTSVAINLGADDYITKPINTDVLLARINGLMRRLRSVSSTLLVVNNLKVDTIENKVFVDGREVKLVNKEFQILKYLVVSHPNYVSTEDLINHIYASDIDPCSSVLRVHISRLRVKLSDANGGIAMIQNKKGKGYHLEI